MGQRILGERVILRKLKKSDARDIRDNANDIVLTRHIPQVPYPYRLKDAKRFIKEAGRDGKKKERFDFGIEYVDIGHVIGVISLIGPDPKERTADIGYWVGRNYRNKGLGGEALNLLLDYAFKELKLRRISAWVLDANEASANVLRKNGFKFEGRQRKSVLHRRKYYDELLYGLLKEDYYKRNRRKCAA
ncbi:MAG: GNAT family N-acetyltransferase [Candidatus Diapherotrites archaeon]|nr:GNAT family N-acetyltransferase [Candidatus Diapherotrites archaeon]